MERRHFVKTAGLTGICSCFVARMLAEDAKPSPQPPAEDWRIDFGKQRYSKLVSLIAAKVDEKTFTGVIEDLGEFCSGTGFAGNYVGRLDDYLAEIKQRWGSESSRDDAAHTIKVSFQTPNNDCACPLMARGLVPAAACHCSVGAMRHAFSTVLGHPVTVELNESALRGDKRCAFTIRTDAS